MSFNLEERRWPGWPNALNREKVPLLFLFRLLDCFCFGLWLVPSYQGVQGGNASRFHSVWPTLPFGPYWWNLQMPFSPSFSFIHVSWRHLPKWNNYPSLSDHDHETNTVGFSRLVPACAKFERSPKDVVVKEIQKEFPFWMQTERGIHVCIKLGLIQRKEKLNKSVLGAESRSSFLLYISNTVWNRNRFSPLSFNSSPARKRICTLRFGCKTKVILNQIHIYRMKASCQYDRVSLWFALREWIMSLIGRGSKQFLTDDLLCFTVIIRSSRL